MPLPFTNRLMKSLAAQPSTRLTAVVDVVQKAAEVVANLKAEIALKDKQLLETKIKAAELKAEIEAIESKTVENTQSTQPPEAFSGVMAILKTKYNNK